MNTSLYDTEHQAKENLEKEFQKLILRHSMFSNSRMELDFKGLNSIRSLIDREAKQLDDLISKIREEEKNCDEYLQKYCPHFYSEISFSSPVTTWLGNKQIEEENNAKERIRKALRNIDDYVKSRSRELANSWADGLKLHFSDISTYGVGRPWGTEIRQRLATAFGLKKEVNSLWELGLNSLANSQHVYLGEHFIGLIKQDPAMEKIREHITRKVISDIRSRAYHVPYLTIQSFEGRISGMKPEEFGGKRSSDDMIQQLKFTLRPQSVLFQNMPTHGMLQ